MKRPKISKADWIANFPMMKSTIFNGMYYDRQGKPITLAEYAWEMEFTDASATVNKPSGQD